MIEILTPKKYHFLSEIYVFSIIILSYIIIFQLNINLMKFTDFTLPGDTLETNLDHIYLT